jgi:hypothetical protein
MLGILTSEFLMLQTQAVNAAERSIKYTGEGLAIWLYLLRLSGYYLYRHTAYLCVLCGSEKRTDSLWKNEEFSDHIFCIRQILETKWEYSEAVHQLFVDCKKAYDSVMREVLYNILIEFGIPLKLVRLIKMCLHKTYSRVWVGKHLSHKFPIKNGLKQGDD